MKSYANLMEKYLSEANYYIGVYNATKQKSGRKRKKQRLKRLREQADRRKDEFLEYAKNFRNDEHTPREINDGISKKKRVILVPTLREQVVHHMIMNVMQPIFMKGMYEHSYGSIPGRGSRRGKNKKTKGAKETIEKWIRTDKRKMKYCLKMDVKRFYDSIPHDILKEKLARIIREKDFLEILYEVIDANGNDVGVPIGFYTSQWFANWYLTDLDHYIKEELKAVHYVRYVDDMVIFDGDKRKLHYIKNKIEEYLNTIGLRLKENWQVFLFDYVDEGHKGRDLDFLGFRFFRDRTILRKSLMFRAARKARKISRSERSTIFETRQMLSYYSWLKCTRTYGVNEERIKPYIDFRLLRRKLSAHDRKPSEVKQ